MNKDKTRFILALIFIISFIIVSGFIIFYGIVTGYSYWNDYQPYFTGMVGIVGIIIGYYFNNLSSAFKED